MHCNTAIYGRNCKYALIHTCLQTKIKCFHFTNYTAAYVHLAIWSTYDWPVKPFLTTVFQNTGYAVFKPACIKTALISAALQLSALSRRRNNPRTSWDAVQNCTFSYKMWGVNRLYPDQTTSSSILEHMYKLTPGAGWILVCSPTYCILPYHTLYSCTRLSGAQLPVSNYYDLMPMMDMNVMMHAKILLPAGGRRCINSPDGTARPLLTDDCMT